MSASDIAHLPFLTSLILFLLCGHLGSYLATRLSQPKVVGEILGGMVLGPSLLGWLQPEWSQWLFAGTAPIKTGIEGIAKLGLLFLMFFSGTEVRSLLQKKDMKVVIPVSFFGLLVPLIAGYSVTRFVDFSAWRGPKAEEWQFAFIFAIAVSVTSIPVISRIFIDLKMISTDFARTILSIAVIEDFFLYAGLTLLLSGAAEVRWGGISAHILISLGFILLSLWLAPAVLRRIFDGWLGTRLKNRPIFFIVGAVLVYSIFASFLNITPMFGAFLVGIAVARVSEDIRDSLESAKSFVFSTFIPIYFVYVGWQLNMRVDFDLMMILTFVIGSSLVKFMGVYLAGAVQGYGPKKIQDFAVALNARGGPGIVLATLAFEAELVSGAFFITLVLAALLTSSFAGWWFGRKVVAARIHGSKKGN